MSEKVLITPGERAEEIKSPGIVLIDTRDPESYAAGHLPGAVNIHDIFTCLATSTPEGVAAMRDMFAAIFGAAGLPGGFGSAARAADDEVVRIGYLPITDAAALLVAHAMGYFQDEGLAAEPPTLIRGWAPLVEAFAAGKFNLVHLLKPIPVWMRYNNNFPVKIMAWAHTNGSGVVVGGRSRASSRSPISAASRSRCRSGIRCTTSCCNTPCENPASKPVIKSQSEPLARPRMQSASHGAAGHAGGARGQENRRLHRGRAVQCAGRD